jgi:hypothetical protein
MLKDFFNQPPLYYQQRRHNPLAQLFSQDLYDVVEQRLKNDVSLNVAADMLEMGRSLARIHHEPNRSHYDSRYDFFMDKHNETQAQVNAMNARLTEQNQTMIRLAERQDGLDRSITNDLGGLERALSGVHDEFNKVSARLNEIEARLDQIERGSK